MSKLERTDKQATTVASSNVALHTKLPSIQVQSSFLHAWKFCMLHNCLQLSNSASPSNMQSLRVNAYR